MSKSGFDQQKEPNDAYSELGVDPESTFEEVQKARDRKLADAGDDLLLKAKIESSYDSLLMNSLKERRLGKISNEAVSASNKEKKVSNIIENGLSKSLVSRFSLFNSSNKENSSDNSTSSFGIPQGEGLTIRLSLGLLVIVLLLVSPDRNIQLILSLATIGLFISQIKRGRKILQSLGWSVVFLSSGYILGGLIVSGLTLNNFQSLGISIDKLEALPVLIILWIGTFI